MLTMYPACFFKEESGYAVIFPDLENGNLSTCGENLEEAMAMAIDCLAGYIHWSWELNDEVPPASQLSVIDVKKVAREVYDGEEDYTEAFVNMISVDVKAYAKEHFEKSVKKTLTIPAWLNDLALERDINFSKVLQEALLTKLRA